MTSTQASPSGTIDPHTALLAQRRLDCDDYMKTLTEPDEPG